MLVARSDPDAPKHQGLTYFLMDMEQDGVEVKPLVQITGEAEFNEIFMEEVFIPDENVVGGVGNGWAVAITTLMNERSGLAFAAQAALEIAVRKVIELAGSTVRNGTSLSKDPVVRDELAQLFMESEIFRITNLRGLSKIMKTGVPGPEGSLGKWQWAEVNQALMELAMDIEGPYAQFTSGSDFAIDDGEWQYQFLRTRANSIEGGTTEILKNIVAERVLGMPKLR
jgi:alkylation response protein AidB-like acyl-CoA dehydrogenase